MGNVVSNAKAKEIEIHKPIEPPKAPEEGEASKYIPSEALLSLWKNIAPGTLNEYIPVYIYKPYSIIKFDDNESYEGYKNYELIKGHTAFNVLVIWDGTDGHINVYELLDGEHAGQLAALSYGSLSTHIGKTMKELIEVAETFKWEDEEEEMMALFKGVFGEFY